MRDRLGKRTFNQTPQAGLPLERDDFLRISSRFYLFV
jgi:hypothetical protein